MVEAINLTKRYPIRGGFHTVLDQVNLRIAPGEKIGILGRNGAGKSTLIRLLGGIEKPDGGVIRHGMRVSWPLAFGGSFAGNLTGMDNLRFICRIYHTSIEDKISFVQDFSELGRYLHEPVRTYSSGMRARLAFALSLIIDFDCYLVDEVIAVGDSRFRERCQYELFEKRADKSYIMVSHHAGYIKAHCRTSAVIVRGRLHRFDSTEAGFEFYEAHASEG
jgi:capsular polysaccharide transport system ATP-binding protein